MTRSPWSEFALCSCDSKRRSYSVRRYISREREAENATTYVPYGPIALIERSQFAHNPRIYEKDAFQALTDIGFRGSWLQWFLKETETFHGM
jgi:hypothetical protein